MELNLDGCEIFVRITKTPPEIWGCCYRSSFGSYLLVISDQLNPNAQLEVLAHELDHVLTNYKTLQNISTSYPCQSGFEFKVRGRNSFFEDSLGQELFGRFPEFGSVFDQFIGGD